MKIKILKCIILILIVLALPDYHGVLADANDYYRQLKILTKDKNWHKAEEVAVKSIGEYPEQIGFHSYYIWTLREQKKHKKAISEGRRAVNKFPGSKGLKRALSYALSGLAAHYIDNKIKKDPLPPATEARELDVNATTDLWYGISLRHTIKSTGKPSAFFQLV